jgi:AcrR family transcriptional regulator
MRKGERIVKKTKTSIKNALLELIHEQNYSKITINQISQSGNIGRSTIYKHYKSKADILVDIHKDMFDYLFSGPPADKFWLLPGPIDELVQFLKKYRKMGRNPFSLNYKLGNDLDYLMSHIAMQLNQTIRKWLSDSYDNEDLEIPLPLLSQSISGSYSHLLTHGFTSLRSDDIDKFVNYVQKIIGTIIKGSVKKDCQY